MTKNSGELEEIDVNQLKDVNNVKGSTNMNRTSRFEGSMVYLAAIAATLSTATMGLSSAFTSSTADSMKSPKTGLPNIGANEISWIASLIQITAIPGAIVAGYLSNALGRHAVMMFSSVAFMIGWLLIAYADSITCIYIGRAIAGFFNGAATVAIHTYLAEVSVPENRALLGAFIPAAFSIGVFCAMSLGMVITWRWLALFGAANATLTTILLCFMPESPRWLMAHGYKSKALKALEFLRGNVTTAALESEFLFAFFSQKAPKNKQRFTLSIFTNPNFYKPLFLSFGLVFFQQFNGAHALISYTESIFEKAGGSLDPSNATLVIAGVQVLSNHLSILIIERAGRRVFFTISGILITIGLLLIGIFIHFSNDNPTFDAQFGWMPLTGFIIFFVGISLGYGPLPAIMTTEMTTQHSRSVISGMATVLQYATSFVVTKTFTDLQQLLGEDGIYFMYASVAFTGIFFGLIFLPETSGKSLEEIQKYFAQDHKIPLLQEKINIVSYGIQ